MQSISALKGSVCLFLFLCSGIIFAQKDTTSTKNIDTEKLIIVKPYSPTVSDAFKIKQQPKVNDSTIQQKKKVTYDIFSIPVASTFKPEKGNAAGVKRQRQPNLYDNYAALGIGNYTNILAEFYSTIDLENGNNFLIGLEHHSSQGGIDGVKLDDNYYDTKLDFGYAAEEQNFSWNARIGGQHQLYNWYGVPPKLFGEQDYDFDPQHNYIAVSAGGDINMKQGVFDKVSLNYRHFGDDFSSSEDHVVVKPNFQFAVGQEKINVGLSADYLTGKFDDFPAGLNYGFLNLGLHPSYNFSRGDLAFSLGAQVVYSTDTENDESDVFVYPKIKGSYRVAGEYFKVYAGAQGGLQQNTYYDFAQKNPYVSPNLIIAPTNKQYDIFIGGKGKFTEQLSYDFRGSYTSEETKPLFLHHTELPFTPPKAYQHANSFGIVYDDINTLSVYGKLSYAVNDDFTLGLDATYNNYSTDKADEAWNLPDIEGSLTAGYQITKQWSAGADLFFTGERYDIYSVENVNIGDGISSKKVNLDSFFDANVRVNYQLTEQLGFFLRGNNLFGDNYERWFGYPVQGIQGMVGASYQF